MPAIHVHDKDTESDIVKVSPPTSHSPLSELKQLGIQLVEQIDEKEDMKGDEEIQRRVEETIRKVREQSDRLQTAALPYAQRTRDFAEHRPVLFTLLAIWIALSAVPVFCFATFLVTATIFIVGVAAIGICLTTLGTILLATSILLPVLLFTLITSTCILSFLLFLFLAHRLYIHLTAASTTASGETVADYEHLSIGVKNWVDETKDRIDISSLGLNGKIRWMETGGVEGGRGHWAARDQGQAQVKSEPPQYESDSASTIGGVIKSERDETFKLRGAAHGQDIIT